MTSDDSKEDNNKNELCFKVIVIGDAGVGKSCLTGRAIKDTFITDYSETIGFEVSNFNITMENKNIILEIFDTCGQEVYRSIISNFYRDVSLAMLVYEIDSRESFLNINQWLNELKQYSHPDVKLILIGNKSDLEDERKVSYEEALKFKDEKQILYFEETSAKTGINAKEVFTEAARILFNEHKKYTMKANNPNDIENNKENKVPKKKLEKVQNRNKGCC